jgi:hydrogenase-4 component F
MNEAPLVFAVLAAPAIGALLSAVGRSARAAEFINLLAAAIALAAAIPLPFLAADHAQTHLASYLIMDRLAAWVTVCTASVYFLSSIFAVGYMRLLDEDAKLPRFYGLFALFALTTLLAPMVNNIGLYWIAIELTTLVSTFLVAFERTPESMEAAWKYIMIVSAGISLALLGTVLLYWAGTFVLGPSYPLQWAVVANAASRLNPALLALAFLLVVIGYGTKVGLAPMHTWLPDAHAEAPAPVSAMLSGALLNAAMVGIVRFLGIVNAGATARLSHFVLVLFGLLSLAIGTLFLVRQERIKRLMAYSSIEHMGVIALGFGFGGPFGTAGALFHMLNHSLNKGLMFFGAGAAMRAYGSPEIGEIRSFGRLCPRTAWLWLAGALSITGAPMFALFLSEFAILRGGLAAGFGWAVYIMAALLILVFVAFLNQYRIMYFERAESAAPGRISAWCVAPMAIALVPLILFGFWWPTQFWTYFQGVAHALGAGAS